jgi:hypothetical protein
MNKAFDHPRSQTAEVRLRVRIRLNLRRLWRWQLWLVEALAARGHVPELDFVFGEPLPSAVRLLLSLESTVLGLAGEHASDLVDTHEFGTLAATAKGDDTPDIVLDLANAGQPDDSGTRWLRPTYDRETDEDELIAALLDGRRVHLTIESSGLCLGSALPAIEDDLVLTRALDSMFSTLLRLCVKAVDEPYAQVVPTELRHPSKCALSWRTLRFAATTVAAKAAGRLTKLCTRAPGWSIRYRWAVEDRIARTHTLPSSGFQCLADDGRRNYADPFVIEVGGTHYLFCEQQDYAASKAVISVTTVPRDGQPATPRPVLEAPHHLSYPFVFEHGGQIWMVPESCASRTVDLYRADPFPDHWVHEATLLSDINASDATLIMHNGEWWMFASIVERQSSSWDSLSIFHSVDLFGPWVAHPRNPVLIDARSARSAGHVYTSGGQLWRPAQDCSEDYGRALALCSIDWLDHENFAQTTRARLSLSRPTYGPHTLNWAAGLEVIDAFT